MVKKILAAAIVATILAFGLSACSSGSSSTAASASESAQSSSSESVKELTVEEIMQALQAKNTHVTEFFVFDEANDNNGLLGRPGEYTGKANFADDRIDESWIQSDEDKVKLGYEGGTIEVFDSEKDCDKRVQHLKGFMNATGLMALNQYMYKYPKAVFRVSYDIVPSEAEVYKAQMDEIMGIEGETVEP